MEPLSRLSELEANNRTSRGGSTGNVSVPSPDQPPVFDRKTATELRAELRRPAATTKETETDERIYKDAWEEVEKLARQQQLAIDVAEIERLERERTDSEGPKENDASRRKLSAREAKDRRARRRNAKSPGESFPTTREVAFSEPQRTESDDGVDGDSTARIFDSTARVFDSTARVPDVTARVFSSTEKTRERTEESEERQEENSRLVQVLEESKSSFRNGRTEAERDQTAQTATLTEPHLWQIEGSPSTSNKSQSPVDRRKAIKRRRLDKLWQGDDHRAPSQNQVDNQQTRNAKSAGKTYSTTREVVISEPQEKKDDDEAPPMRRRRLFDSTAQKYDSAARTFDSAAQSPKSTTELRQVQMLKDETPTSAMETETEAARTEQQKGEEKQDREVQICIAKSPGNPLFIVTREATTPEQQTTDDSAAQRCDSTTQQRDLTARGGESGKPLSTTQEAVISEQRMPDDSTARRRDFTAERCDSAARGGESTAEQTKDPGEGDLSQQTKGETYVSARSESADSPIAKDTIKDERRLEDEQKRPLYRNPSNMGATQKEQEDRPGTWGSSEQRRANRERGKIAFKAAKKTRELRRLGWTATAAIKEAMTRAAEERTASDTSLRPPTSNNRAKVQAASQQAEQQAETFKSNQKQSASNHRQGRYHRPRLKQTTENEATGEKRPRREVPKKEEGKAGRHKGPEVKENKGTQRGQGTKGKRWRKRGKREAEPKGRKEKPIKNVSQNSRQTYHLTKNLWGGGKRPPEPKADH